VGTGSTSSVAKPMARMSHWHRTASSFASKHSSCGASPYRYSIAMFTSSVSSDPSCALSAIRTTWALFNGVYARQLRR